ncbi:MAG: glycosyltransferase family 2 protein [Prevotella bivia]|uniref:glycosyltransferase family 2 protein n=1 Tax=Prevotella bivia TaxID=28125 RepID=UPI00051070A5|nr:glycosyltransferase family A protein [Prevotella bivia]KGF20263.1 glycosyl transferase [Prevotella bivia DNF00188]MBS6329323.1 glycosyltransferase family 2 protein [Prevotella bivia]
MMITVFTPTYNRGNLLKRLYDSLCNQSFKDFEWLIVDDGSTDNTGELMKQIMTDGCNKFVIRYFKKANGGKHSAINFGVKEAKGELFFIVDSDDILPPFALQDVIDVWHNIYNKEQYAGVCGLDGYLESESVIGSGFPIKLIKEKIKLSSGEIVKYIDGTNMDIRFGIGIQGDMKEIFKTDVLREFPFPEIRGEKFCPEVLIWNRIGAKYKMRYFDKVVYLAEYQEGGITAGITKARMNSPIASMMTYQEMTTYDIPLKWKIRSAINYWRFRQCLKNKDAEIPKLSILWNIFMPIGLLMHNRDLKNVRR